jgi:hypothetical protein
MARGTCIPPRLFTPSYAGTYWPAGTTVNVEIDDAWSDGNTDEDIFALANGVQKWNLVKLNDCSLVTFTGFAKRHFDNYSTDPPENTWWFQRDDPGTGYAGGVYHHAGGVPLHLISARDKIAPWAVNFLNHSYYIYLGSHET